MKTQLQTTILFSLILLLIVGGCRRGEDDPRISLRSRDGRLTGTWELESATGSIVEVSNDTGVPVTMSSTITYSGGQWRQSGNGFSVSYNYTERLSLEEDQSYLVVASRDNTEDRLEGYWSWENGRKNKTGLTLHRQDAPPVFSEIVRLSASELVLRQQAASSSEGYGPLDSSKDYDVTFYYLNAD